jgi:hypothetical protein
MMAASDPAAAHSPVTAVPDGLLVFTRQLADGEHRVSVDRATLRPRECSCPLSTEGLVCRAALEVAAVECVDEARQRAANAFNAMRSANTTLEEVLIAAGRASFELVDDGLQLQPVLGPSVGVAFVPEQRLEVVR